MTKPKLHRDDGYIFLRDALYDLQNLDSASQTEAQSLLLSATGETVIGRVDAGRLYKSKYQVRLQGRVKTPEGICWDVVPKPYVDNGPSIVFRFYDESNKASKNQWAWAGKEDPLVVEYGDKYRNLKVTAEVRNMHPSGGWGICEPLRAWLEPVAGATGGSASENEVAIKCGTGPAQLAMRQVLLKPGAKVPLLSTHDLVMDVKSVREDVHPQNVDIELGGCGGLRKFTVFTDSSLPFKVNDRSFKLYLGKVKDGRAELFAAVSSLENVGVSKATKVRRSNMRLDRREATPPLSNDNSIFVSLVGTTTSLEPNDARVVVISPPFEPIERVISTDTPEEFYIANRRLLVRLIDALDDNESAQFSFALQ